MRKSKMLLILWCLAILINFWIVPVGLAQDERQTGLEDSFSQALTLSGRVSGSSPGLISVVRLPLVDNLVEYTYILKVGEGRFDRIGLHRVVKEEHPFVPVRTDSAVMMVHGDSCNFRSEYLMPTDLRRSAAVCLAKKNIDVWGIDLRWTLVPAITTDFSFMKDWNTDTHLADIDLGIKAARAFRKQTGDGDSKIFLLGHSRGAQFVYAYANQETQLAETERNLCGIIPMDMIYKLPADEQAMKNEAYARYLACKSTYESGKYHSEEGVQMKALAGLAGAAPDVPSLVITGLTNKQAALLALTSTYATYKAPLKPPTSFYHYTAGIFDNKGLPSGLRYANYYKVLEAALISADYQSLGEMIDGEAIISDAVEVPYDDHLSEISVPVLYVGAAGGMGPYGEYTLKLLGSSDKTSLIIQKESPESAALDFGHADLVWAENAPSEVWEPIGQWIKTH